MRAAVSPVVELTDQFVPDSHVIGTPGLHFTDNWSIKADLGFAAQYLGASQGTLDLIVSSMIQRGLNENLFALQQLGQAKTSVEATRWQLYAAALMWCTATQTDAEQASIAAKLQSIRTANLVLDCASRIAGPSAFTNVSALTRITRDLRFFMLREDPDAAAVAIGRHLVQTEAPSEKP
jgi:alkylation response protein AidB-like acyl-CoA dehydrogenase